MTAHARNWPHLCHLQVKNSQLESLEGTACLLTGCGTGIGLLVTMAYSAEDIDHIHKSTL